MSRFDGLEFDEPRKPGQGAAGAAPGAKPGEAGRARVPGLPGGAADDSARASAGANLRASAAPAFHGGGTPIRDAAWHQAEADSAFRLGDYEAALRSYSRALEDTHTVVPCWVGQVRSLIELGELKEANLWVKKSLELFPDHPELLAARAVATARSGMIKTALAYSDHSLSKSGGAAYVWLARGEVLTAARRRMAEHCFGQALARAADQRERAWTRIDIAQTLMRYKRFAQALVHAEQGAQLLPTEAAAWQTLGLIQAAMRLEAARDSLDHALQLNPELPKARHALEHLPGPSLARRLVDFILRR